MRSLLLLALLAVCLPLSAAEGRRNVLFIISDDLNNYLGCYGDPRARTPNLDRLAGRGVRFDRAYCTYPLCGPSRNSLLTGLYPNSTGIHQNALIFRQSIPAQLSLPQAFRLQGYFAARLGKLYHYNVPNSVGTDGHDDPASWELEMNPAGVDRMEELDVAFSVTPKQFGGTLSWHPSEKSDEHHTDGMLARDAEWVLERCARDRSRPFFLAVGFFRPHTPYISPKAPYWGQYDPDQMPLFPKVGEQPAGVPKAAFLGSRKDQEDLPDDVRRKAVQAYYASISFMDAQVGRVISALDRLGLAESTVVVFTSDHGYHMGEHGLYQKMSLFENAARVPLLVVAPGVAGAGTVVRTPVSHVDLFRTLTELAGITPPANVQGQSLVPILKDPSAVGRGWAVTQLIRGGVGRVAASTAASQVTASKKKNALKPFFGYSLRTDRWRYTEWDEGREGRELYDHDVDPGELINLADKSEHARTVAALSTQLKEAVKTTFPADGKTPEVKEVLWSPLIKDAPR
jgi:iduronate 2-sulfatase